MTASKASDSERTAGATFKALVSPTGTVTSHLDITLWTDEEALNYLKTSEANTGWSKRPEKKRLKVDGTEVVRTCEIGRVQ